MPHSRFHPRQKNGFFFADALIAAVIISIALVALTMTYTQSTKVSIAASDRQTALYLAQSELETIRQTYEKTPGPVIGHTNTTSRNNKTFLVTTAVLPQPAALAAYTITPVEVTVSWSPRDAVSLQAYIYLQ